MSNKQTAVEWLESELKNQGFLYNLDIEAAKEMEKENLRDAYEADTNLEFYSIIDKKFEKYYKKTYGK